MNKYLLTVGLVILISLAFAQNPIGQGQTQLNLGVGLSSWGIPIYGGLDFGISNDFSLGAELSYRAYREHYNNHDYDRSVIGISGNGNYHFNRVLNIPRNWDFYAGLNIGFYVWDDPDDYHGDNTSGLGLGAQVGMRYYFTDSFGVNLEFGGGNAFSGGKLGLSFKL